MSKSNICVELICLSVIFSTRVAKSKGLVELEKKKKDVSSWEEKNSLLKWKDCIQIENFLWTCIFDLFLKALTLGKLAKVC